MDIHTLAQELIDLHSLDLSTLPWFPLEYHRVLPKAPAVYFVLDPSQAVLYIGRANDIQSRWESHHRLAEYVGTAGLRIALLFVRDKLFLLSLEAACIAFFNPRDNHNGSQLPPRPVRIPPESKVLRHLEHGHPLSLRDLGRHTGLRNATILPILEALIQEGRVQSFKTNRTTKYVWTA